MGIYSDPRYAKGKASPPDSLVSTAASTPLTSPLLFKCPPDLSGSPTSAGWWARLRLCLGLSSQSMFRLVMAGALVSGMVVGAVGSVTAWALYSHGSGGLPWGGHWPPAAPMAWRQGERRRLVVHGRDVWVYQPPQPGMGASPLPAVVVLHGSNDTALNIANATGMEKVAGDTTGFLAVFPEMIEPRGMSWGFNDTYELAFFRALVERLGSEYALRKDQVYVCGHSNGGTMSLFLQNNMADIFSGAAVVESGVGHLDVWNNQSKGRPTMVIWNHNDPVLAEFGGEGLYQDTLAKLRRHDHTGVGPSSMDPLPVGAGGVLYAEKLSWHSSADVPAMSVISWASITPTHHWLNSAAVPGTSLDASWLIWQFFSSLPSQPAQWLSV